jgi:hypothetical protein
LHKAAHHGNIGAIRELVAKKVNLEARDPEGRTPLHVAAFASQDEALRALATAGADLNALDNQAYDIVTIAAVDNDLQFMDLALSLGAKPGNVTSPYEGTALIAAAPGAFVLSPDQPDERLLPSAAADVPLPEDSVLSIRTPAGGGYGPVEKRDPQRVEQDVREARVFRQASS